MATTMALALPESTRTMAALVYGCLWMFMDVYGCLWMFMDVYGYSHGKPAKIAIWLVVLTCFNHLEK